MPFPDHRIRTQASPRRRSTIGGCALGLWICLAFNAATLVPTLRADEPGFLDERPPATTAGPDAREGAFGERAFISDLPLGVSDGNEAIVYDDAEYRRHPGLGWRPGMFLHRLDFDWREWVWLPQFGVRDPDDPLRHRGWGEPMVGTSWRNRPVSIDWAFGGTGTAGLSDSARQTGGTIGGYRLGYDFDHYWGLEWRHLWASANLRSPLDVNYSATTQHQFFDVSLLYFPWGDARWRPYAGIGLGMANYDFLDGAGLTVDETMLTMPISAGIKYYVQPWAVLRLDLSETIVFPGSEVDSHAQFMAIVGTEFRFGGKRTKYYPWETGWKP